MKGTALMTVLHPLCNHTNNLHCRLTLGDDENKKKRVIHFFLILVTLHACRRRIGELQKFGKNSKFGGGPFLNFDRARGDLLEMGTQHKIKMREKIAVNEADRRRNEAAVGIMRLLFQTT
jgi:hypothetical protein